MAHRFRDSVVGVACVVMMGSALPAQELGPIARQQIEALLAEKASRNPAQQKMGSNLVIASKMIRGQRIHPALPSTAETLRAVRADARNSVEVDVRANLNPALFRFIQSLGGSMEDASAELQSVRVRMPLAEVERLAERDDVRSIQLNERALVRGVPVATNAKRDAASVRQSVASQLSRYFQGQTKSKRVRGSLFGSLDSAFFVGPNGSGDIAHQTDVARSTYNLDGTGVKIGVISTGAGNLAAEQAAGRLSSNVTIIPGRAGTGSEGTAMMEIIYTLAPGASLYFSTGAGSRDTMALSMQALADAGCKVIVDDLYYPTEAIYQDDVLAQKVNALVAQGIVMVSAAGNDGNKARNTSATWEGDFHYSGVAYTVGIAHGFGSSSTNPITAPSPIGLYMLQWAEPLGKATGDLDLFILNSSQTLVLAASTGIQNGTGDPREIITVNPASIPSGSRILVLNYLQTSGSVGLHVSAYGGQLGFNTSGNLVGHAAVPGVISVAAVDVQTASGRAFTGGEANPVEKYSSDGPRRIFFNEDGTPITPGNYVFANNGGSSRMKPDVAAADNVPTGVTGYNPFPGASAAAPHVAAIVALLLQANPALTVSQVKAILYSTALDIETQGFDILSGAGIAMAPGAISAAINSRNCTYSVSPLGRGFPPAGGAGTLTLDTLAGCPWTLTTTTGWILPPQSSSGSGPATLTFQVTPNSGPARSSNILIGNQLMPIEQTGGTFTNGKAIGAFGHVTSQGTWKFTLDSVNLGNSSATARYSFADDTGAPLAMPITFPPASVPGQAAATAPPLLTSTLDRTLGANAQLILESTGPDSASPLIGWGQLAANGTVNGFGIFSNASLHWDAVVPLETRQAPKYLLAFDNTGVLATGVAVANMAAQAANIVVVIRDDNGTQIGTSTINLPAQGHASFMLNQQYSVTSGKRGTVEFRTPSGGQIAVLGLRANGPALTTLPVLANVEFNGGSIAHVTYNGGFTSSFYLVNTGTASAQYTLKIYGESGSPLAAPLSLPQTSETLTASTLTKTLAPGAMQIIETVAQDNLPAVSGSAQLTTNGQVSGFEIFRWTTFGQEASVPLETRAPSSFILLFDNSNGLTTGVALANLIGSEATLTARIYDETGLLLSSSPVTLAALGHSSFLLPSNYPTAVGRRGMVEFVIPPASQISAVGLRAKADGTLTTIPVLSK
ncbi:MAG: S8 family serine peptidase [Bryobacteraceae bacterium]